MRNIYLILALCSITFGACALFENNEALPMFIEVDSVDLTTTFDQGTNSHNIIDIWPNVDGQSLGVFEIPINFPVLDDDSETNFVYFAGVKRVGVADDHIIYPFYDRITFDRAFTPEMNITEELVFEYREDIVFRFVEGFNATSHEFMRDIDGDELTEVAFSTDDCAEGTCGLIVLTPDNPDFAVSTNIDYPDIPTNGNAAFLELEYKSDISLFVGLQSEVNGTDFDEYFIELIPTDIWKKVYIELTPTLQASGLDSYRVLFAAVNIGEETEEIRIDNVKLIHF